MMLRDSGGCEDQFPRSEWNWWNGTGVVEFTHLGVSMAMALPPQLDDFCRGQTFKKLDENWRYRHFRKTPFIQDGAPPQL